MSSHRCACVCSGMCVLGRQSEGREVVSQTSFCDDIEMGTGNLAERCKQARWARCCLSSASSRPAPPPPAARGCVLKYMWY